jgi:hypothetical protein
MTQQLNETRQRFILLFFAFILFSAFITSCDKDDDDVNYLPQPNVKVVSASGDLAAALAEFRHILGDSLNTVPGKTSGRREVNWDGVPANLNNNPNFPFDFFNSTDPAVANGRKRGLVYVNDGTLFRVDSSDFADLELSNGAQFDAFSGKRTFSSANSNITEAIFKVPGTNNDAFIKGFGVIFIDVDNANSTTVEFFSGNKSLGVFKAPVRTAGSSFSFLGVHFPDEKVTRIKIVAGNGLVITGAKDMSSGGTQDLVIMDDVFYNEPLPVQ